MIPMDSPVRLLETYSKNQVTSRNKYVYGPFNPSSALWPIFPYIRVALCKYVLRPGPATIPSESKPVTTIASAKLISNSNSLLLLSASYTSKDRIRFVNYEWYGNKKIWATGHSTNKRRKIAHSIQSEPLGQWFSNKELNEIPGQDYSESWMFGRLR